MKRIKSCHKNVGQEEEARAVGIVFMKSPEDTASEEFAQSGTSIADALMDLEGLFTLELDSVGEQAVY